MAFWFSLAAGAFGIALTNLARTPDVGNIGMALATIGGFLAFVFGLVWLFGG